jgi:hypothetical protein
MWYSIKNKKPELKQKVLIYCQGYDVTGKHHWEDYYVAVYDINYRDKRKKAFYSALDYKVESIYDGSTMRNVWQYTGVISWMPLPDPPEKISPEKYADLAGYEYEDR